jgi:hypothetical protein
MISDVLFDAVEEIRRYQRDMPDAYESMQAEIDAVTTAMDLLRAKLDAPPSSGSASSDVARHAEAPRRPRGDRIDD